MSRDPAGVEQRRWTATCSRSASISKPCDGCERPAVTSANSAKCWVKPGSSGNGCRRRTRQTAHSRTVSPGFARRRTAASSASAAVGSASTSVPRIVEATLFWSICPSTPLSPSGLTGASATGSKCPAACSAQRLERVRPGARGDARVALVLGEQRARVAPRGLLAVDVQQQGLQVGRGELGEGLREPRHARFAFDAPQMAVHGHHSRSCSARGRTGSGTAGSPTTASATTCSRCGRRGRCAIPTGATRRRGSGTRARST